MGGTKKRRLKPFSRKRKEKQKRLDKQVAEYGETLARTIGQDLKDKRDFKTVLTIRPLVLASMKYDKLDYVEPRVIQPGEFPVLEDEFKEAKKKLKDYEKKKKQLGRLRSLRGARVEVLEKEVEDLLADIKELDGVLLLNTKSAHFLRGDYRKIVETLDLSSNTDESKWWSEDSRDKDKLFGLDKWKKYSSSVDQVVTAQKAATLDAGVKRTLASMKKQVINFLDIAESTLTRAKTVMDRFARLSTKTRILGRKTFYGEGYTEISGTYTQVRNARLGMENLLSEICLAESGMMHVIGGTQGRTDTACASVFLELAERVSAYNQQTSELHSLMNVRYKMAGNAFEKTIVNTVNMLDDLIKDGDLVGETMEGDKDQWSNYCLNLRSRFNELEKTPAILANLTVHYADLENELKSSVLGKLILLKDRYGQYLDAIQSLCNSLPKVF